MNLQEQYRAFLKAQGLEDAQIEKIVKAMSGAKLYLSSEEDIDKRYQKLKGQKELLDEQLKGANETIETLKKANTSDEDLQAEVQKYKDANKALQEKYDKDVVTVEKKQQVMEALKKEGAIHPDLLIASVDLEKIELKDGKITGHKDAIKSLKESYKDQFKEEDPNAEEGDNGGGNEPYSYTPPGGKPGDSKTPADIYAAMAAYSVHQ